MANKKSQDYDALENQIGDLGGEVEQPKEQSLGKLKHNPTSKPELDEEEKSEMEEFLNRSRRKSAFGRQQDDAD